MGGAISRFLGVVDILTAGFVSYVQSIITAVMAINTQQLQQRFQDQNNYVDADAQQQATEILDAIKTEGQRVLLVSHSQGGLYANAAHRLVYLDPEVSTKSLMVVAVATPANYVADNGAYTTSDNDVVIKAVRQFIASQTLPSNISVPFHFDDMSGHFFVKTYLHNDYPARNVISSNMKAALANLERPDDTYNFEIRAPFIGLLFPSDVTPPQPTGLFNAYYEAAEKVNPGVRQWARSTPDGFNVLWSIRDLSKRKLDGFAPEDQEFAILASNEVKRRIGQYNQNAITPGKPLSVFLSGKGPFFAHSIYLTPPPESAERDSIWI